MNQRGEPQCRSDRLTHCVFKRAKLIRRFCIADIILAIGHMTELKGRTYDCTVRLGETTQKNLATGAVPHMRQRPILARENGLSLDKNLNRRRAVSHATLRAAHSSQQHNMQTGASQPLSLNPTGTLSRRYTAHFVSAVDRSGITQRLTSIWERVITTPILCDEFEFQARQASPWRPSRHDQDNP